IRKSHNFNQPTIRVTFGFLTLGPRCRVIDRLLASSIDDAAVYPKENRDGTNRVVVIESVDAIVRQGSILESLICRGFRPVPSGSGVVGERRVLSYLPLHPPRFLCRLSSGLFGSFDPLLVLQSEGISLLESLGGSQILLIKLDPIGYQVALSISPSL